MKKILNAVLPLFQQVFLQALSSNVSPPCISISMMSIFDTNTNITVMVLMKAIITRMMMAVIYSDLILCSPALIYCNRFNTVHHSQQHQQHQSPLYHRHRSYNHHQHRHPFLKYPSWPQHYTHAFDHSYMMHTRIPPHPPFSNPLHCRPSQRPLPLSATSPDPSSS